MTRKILIHIKDLEKKVIIGIDIGGTKIMIGAITQDGTIQGTPIKFPTNSSDPSETIINRIVRTVEELLENLNLYISDVIGIGIGSTGPLDIELGMILDCPQLPTMNYFPLREIIEEHFPVPVFMNNDANCLIYAETIFGTAKGMKNVLGFTLGTGIGCAIILDGKIINGATGNAGEVWTSPYGVNIIEDFISGQGVKNIYKSITGKQKSSLEILKLTESGDKNALETWKIFGEHLSVPVSWAINLIDPEVVILGGSIANAHPYFLPHLEKKLSSQICSVPASKTKIYLSKLGDYAGFIGAACLVIENKK